MIDVLIPQHIFVSYSHTDKEIADKIIIDLRKAHINVWVDSTGLKPGTPNWNTAIRDAIRYSFAVLLIASPNSGQSNAVQGELAIARSQGCPVYPLWVAGNEWVDCVPLDMIQVQYIDGRNLKYESGLSQAIKTLEEIINTRLPKHCLLTKKYFRSHSSISWPFGYLFIHLDGDGNQIIMRYILYQSLQELLNDLYTEYLKDKYAPYSYGKEWILSIQRSLFEENRDINRLLVPWSWLLRSENQPISSFDPTWAAGLPKTNEIFFESLCLDTDLEVIDKLPLSVFGVVTNNLSAAENLSRRTKERWFFSSQIVKMIDNKSSSYKDERIHIETTSLEVIHPNDYKYQFIFSAHLPQLDRKAFIIKSYTDPFQPPPPLW